MIRKYLPNLMVLAMDAWPVVLAILVVTVVFRLTGLDMAVQSFFYNPYFEMGFDEHLFFYELIYKYSPTVSIAAAVAAGAALLASFFWTRARPYRKSALFIILYLTLGAGLLVNFVFKDHWGRPRPRQLSEFSVKGKFDYVPPWSFGGGGRNSSFPGGHAANAYVMTFPYFLLRKSRPGVAWAFLSGGIVWWGCVALARVGQGAHFTSDVILAALIMHLVGIILAAVLRPEVEWAKALDR